MSVSIIVPLPHLAAQTFAASVGSVQGIVTFSFTGPW